MTRGCPIRLHQLSVIYPGEIPTLENWQADFAAGSFVGLVGPSGCGKSTLLRCVAGLQRPSSGQVEFADQSPELPKLAFVFQDPTLLPWRSVVDNVALPLELRGTPVAVRRSAAQSSLRTAGLAAADDHKRPSALSGGMRMRVSLARALVTQPDLLLLDEPFAALDDLSRQQLNNELMQMWLHHGWTSLFVTHNVAEAVFLCQRILVLTHRPARIVKDVIIPWDYPRRDQLRLTPEFTRVVAEVTEALHAHA